MEKFLVVIFVSYLIGNFATSYILGKMFKSTDIRQHGSGNAGATNALRVFGLRIAATTFILDALKGSLAVLIGKYILGDDGALIAGFFVVVGHNWPVFLKFKGGKGVASTIGVMLSINYLIALISVFIGLIFVRKTGYVSLGSIIGMSLLPVIELIVVKPFNLHFFIFTLALSIMAILKHKSNIIRLVKGEELKISKNAH